MKNCVKNRDTGYVIMSVITNYILIEIGQTIQRQTFQFSEIALSTKLYEGLVFNYDVNCLLEGRQCLC